MIKRRNHVVTGLVAAGVLVSLGWYAPAGAAPAKAAVSSARTSATPVMDRDLKPGVPLSAAQEEEMAAKLQAMRNRMSASVPQAGGAKVAPMSAAGPSTVGSADGPGPRFHGNPGDLIIGRNSANTVANTNTCGNGRTLAEPAAANEGAHVYSTGNLSHQEFSTNGGATWTCAAAYPAGPAAAPTAFGDTDVIYDHSRGVTFHSVIYVNATLTDGVIGIFVRRNIRQADNCTYFIDLDPNANVLPDYPHLGMSNDFLYFNANRVGTSWLGATVERLSLDQLADCVTANGSVVNFTNTGGQRILVPGHGARDVMYFAWVNTTTQWRVFSWADNSGSVLSTFVNVGTLTFANADCRGGTNNADWSDGNATSITGFNVRTAVGNDFVNVWAAVAPDAGHTHAYIRGAMFRIGAAQNALTLVQEPQIFFGDRCAGEPNVGTNDRGDQGLSIALGGANGGNGPAVTTAVGMKDQFNPGPGGFFLLTVAAATHNPTRFGDYTTVRRNAPCGEFFDTTGYGLNNGTGLANVNARYVEFGRGRDAQCYNAWNNAVPAN